MIGRLVLLLFLCGGACLPAQVLVLPPQVESQSHSSYFWIGKAVSFYLISGLAQNDLAVVSEEDAMAILDRNRIRFPFDIAKATALQVARQGQAKKLLFGQVQADRKNPALLSVRLVLCDVERGDQRYLPVIKGNAADLYRILEELLRTVVRVLDPQRTRPVEFPALKLDLADYEKVVKSLLATDLSKKIEMLVGLAEAGKNSDFLFFELGKNYTLRKAYGEAEFYLTRIVSPSPLARRASFLLALGSAARGDRAAAIGRFTTLVQAGLFPFETHHNLGVLHLGSKEWSAAETHLRKALMWRRDADTSLSLLLLLLETDRRSELRRELGDALARFPGNEGLIRLFAHLVMVDEDQENLLAAFGEVIPASFFLKMRPDLPLSYKNPFGGNPLPPIAPDTASLLADAQTDLIEGNLDEAQGKIEDSMDLNPYLAEGRAILARILDRRKNPAQAEIQAVAALFLEPSVDHYLLLLGLYRELKDPLAFARIRARALADFPQNQELLSQK
ncbi:MAG TPA: hypothetical protein PKK12_04025 [Candidatus Aminicenantes bacterium]|nr:hypothetical protein [Candidatus Aminicenantes bacterium]